MAELARLYPVRREHLDALSDEVGILQHAIGRRPDPGHGYCTDDVARALVVDIAQQREVGWQPIEASAWRSLRFLIEAFNPATRRFRNLRRIDGQWLDSAGSEDANARALVALADSIAGAPSATFAEAADSLFRQALPMASSLAGLRPRAAVLLACEAGTRAGLGRETSATYRSVAHDLWWTFDSRGPSPEWPYPDAALTYENGLPAHALIVAGARLGHPAMVRTGLRVLDWLIGVQTAPEGHLSPVGNLGWWPRDGARAQFDQQPIEAATLLHAAAAAYETTGEGRYREAAELCYGWFLGANDTGARVADPERGACHDGLTPRGVNENQGAESTLAWLAARAAIRRLRGVAGGASSVAGGVAAVSSR